MPGRERSRTRSGPKAAESFLTTSAVPSGEASSMTMISKSMELLAFVCFFWRRKGREVGRG